MKVCFLASGGGGHFKFLYLAKTLNIIKNIELFVIADRKCASLEFALKNGVYAKQITYSKINNEELLYELKNINPDIIVTNWYKIIDLEVIKEYKQKLINLHYSLLPAYGGLIGIAPIKQAYAAGCKYIGTTCHYVDVNVDSGLIISQAIVKTNVPIKQAIQETFSKACLILLSYLITISKTDIITEMDCSEDLYFEPTLKFKASIFSRDFWENLSEL